MELASEQRLCSRNLSDLSQSIQMRFISACVPFILLPAQHESVSCLCCEAAALPLHPKQTRPTVSTEGRRIIKTVAFMVDIWVWTHRLCTSHVILTNPIPCLLCYIMSYNKLSSLMQNKMCIALYYCTWMFELHCTVINLPTGLLHLHGERRHFSIIMLHLTFTVRCINGLQLRLNDFTLFEIP